LSELLAKSAADSKINGVVGNRGKKAPNMPNPRLIRPNNAMSFFNELVVYEIMISLKASD
jgi:hypothetical protein